MPRPEAAELRALKLMNVSTVQGVADSASAPDFLEPIDLAAIAARVLGFDPQPETTSPRKETEDATSPEAPTHEG